MNVAPNGAPIDTLAEVLVAGIALGEDGEAVDGLNLIADWVAAHFEGGAISRWLDACDALRRLAELNGYEDPDLAAIRDFIDPIPVVDDAETLDPATVHDLLTRLNAAMGAMDRTIRELTGKPISRALHELNEARPPAYLFGEIGAMRDAAARAMRTAKRRK